MGQIAKELDRIAEAVIVEHQHALGLPPGSLPAWKARSKRLSYRLSFEPTRLVALKSSFEVTKRQHEAAPSRDSFAAAERDRSVKRRHRFREAAKIPQRQSLTQQRLGQARPRLARPEIGVKRLLAAIELQKRVTEIDCGLGKIMTQLKRPLSRFDRFFWAPEFAQCSRAAAPGVRIMGREPRRRCESSRERLP